MKDHKKECIKQYRNIKDQTKENYNQPNFNIQVQTEQTQTMQDQIDPKKILQDHT